MKEHQEIDLSTPVKKRSKNPDEQSRLCDRLNIVDLFVSLQGEGIYVGMPSLFVRVSGCNLRCCFKDTVCDTAYSSFNPEKGRFSKEDVVAMLQKNPNVADIVFTGGEPLMFGNELDDLIEYIGYQTDMDYRITIETNGTFGPLNHPIDLYSISPKLSTSIPVPDKPYHYMHDGKEVTRTFTKAEVEKLNETRYNPEAIAALIDDAEFQLKFVYSGPESVHDIDMLVDRLRDMGRTIYPDDIMLMPEGITAEQINKNGREAAKICIERSWRLADRLHIRLWGDKRGV